MYLSSRTHRQNRISSPVVSDTGFNRVVTANNQHGPIQRINAVWE